MSSDKKNDFCSTAFGSEEDLLQLAVNIVWSLGASKINGVRILFPNW